MGSVTGVDCESVGALPDLIEPSCKQGGVAIAAEGDSPVRIRERWVLETEHCLALAYDNERRQRGLRLGMHQNLNCHVQDFLVRNYCEIAPHTGLSGWKPQRQRLERGEVAYRQEHAFR